METRTVRLREALEVGGKEISVITLRRSTVGDEEDAMQQAIQLKRGKNPVTVEMCLFARVTRLPYDAIRSMSGQDYAAMREAHNALSGFSPEEDAEAEGDPTMQKSD